MNDPYAFPEDLRRLISSRNHLTTTTQQPPSLYASSSSSSFPPPFNNNSYDPIMQIGDAFYPRAAFTHHYDYYSSSSNTLINPIPIPIPTTTPSSAFAALQTNSSHNNKTNWLAFDPSNNRWPRQETLSLLEIRSRLHSKFKDNNHKAPLWNEISRIMAEEFGYQRSGKKCKEKFENLYKYYKKTKEGKASRQDGKHYRFFRQLEAICGESNTTHHHASTSDNTTLHHAANAAVDSHQTPSFTINQENVINIGDHQNLNNNFKYSESLTSFSNSSEFEITSSCENNDDEDLSAVAHMMKQPKEKGLVEDQRQSDDKRVRKSWRVKVEEIVDYHMRNIIETQDTWMEKMLSVVEQREQEMALKEEERKRKESMRCDKEIHELWAKEKAWVEARDAALLEVVRKHIGIENKEALVSYKNKSQVNDTKYGYPFENVDQRWTEMEISSLIQLRTSFEQRVRENGDLDDGVWNEIGEKMVYMGFDRNGIECKKIWHEISMSLRRTVDCGVKTRPWCLGLKVTDDDEI